MPFDTEYVETPTDFTAGDVNVPFGSADQIASSIVKRAITLSITDTDEPGSEVLHINLDKTITEEVAALAEYYEEFEIKDLHISFQSTSPMGVASGALQVAHIPDPENATLSDDLMQNLDKLVRQSGSVIVRPRDTKDLKVDTNLSCFTKTSSDSRFSSFGSIIAVVRDKPSAGDQAVWTTTLEATFQFLRPTILSSVTTFTDQVMLTKHNVTPTGVYFMLPDLPTNGELQTTFLSLVALQYDVCNKLGKLLNSRVVELRQVILRPTSLANLYLFDLQDYIKVPFKNLKFVSEDKIKSKVKYTPLQ